MTQASSGLLRRGLSIAGVVIVLDQVSKWWILTRVMDPPRVIEVLPFFNLVMVWNRGISFGLFNTASPWAPWILSGLALAICAFLVIWMIRDPGRWSTPAIGLIIGGALGNVIDRMLYGAVADFIDLHVGGHHWPAFNVADASITLGAAILILDSLFHKDNSS